MKITKVTEEEFRPYGRVLKGYDYTELFQALEETPNPSKGFGYEASVPKLEACRIFEEIRAREFGGMPIQAGYCNGNNCMLNCLEYHKSSELNIAKDDIVLLLGLSYNMENGKYDTARVKAFLVPAGTGVELYATTLHYAPCGYRGENFQVVCILPKGTNDPLDIKEEPSDHRDLAIPENKLWAAKNKWLLAHPDSEEAREGAYIGLEGENIRWDFEA